MSTTDFLSYITILCKKNQYYDTVPKKMLYYDIEKCHYLAV